MSDDFCNLDLRSLPKAPTWKEDLSVKAGLQRLRVLAAFLEQVPEERYDQNVWRDQHACGTVACALGWAGTTLSELTGFEFSHGGLTHDYADQTGTSVITTAETIFGLRQGEGRSFFSVADNTVYPVKPGRYGSSRVLAADVAKTLNAYVDKRLGKDD